MAIVISFKLLKEFRQIGSQFWLLLISMERKGDGYEKSYTEYTNKFGGWRKWDKNRNFTMIKFLGISQ